MNYFLLFLALLTIVISFVLIYFQDQIQATAVEILIRFTKSDISPPVPNGALGGSDKIVEPSPPQPKWVPPGFIGPAGEPRIIGPRGNPPNY